MPLLHKKLFEPKQFVSEKNSSPNDEVFYLKMTNEVFESHDEYFERVILCNSLVWGCSLTGRSNLTYQEAVESEKAAAKTLSTIPKGLRKAIFYLVTLTRRGKVLDVCDDIFSYTREHYFIGEIVMGVIGNMWCHSNVMRVVAPTADDIEEYKRDQIEKGEIDNNDYLKDDSWGPPPDLFRYEVCETDPDNPEVDDVYMLEALDVKREKAVLTREKCRCLIKLNTYYDSNAGFWKIKDEVAKHYELAKVKFEHIFVGEPPIFEETVNKPQPPKQTKPKVSTSSKSVSNNNSPTSTSTTTPNGGKKRKSSLGNNTDGGKNSSSSKNKKLKIDKKENEMKKGKGTPKGQPKPVQLSPSELKQIELAKKVQEREKAKANKKLIADFKKLWFKTKEDLMVEDLKDLPEPEPVNCRIPNNLFGDFMMILEYCHCYSNIIKIRDYFPSGLTFESLEKILFSNEIAGPFNELLQLLLKTIFRLQMDEEYDKIIEPFPNAEYNADTQVDLNLSSITKQNNNVYNWSKINQNTPLNRLSLDHLTLNEILRLHLLSSGAMTSSEEAKWRFQQRGIYASTDDPGLDLILNTDIIPILSNGSIFDLTLANRIKLISCLINQILTYTSIRELMEENLESFKKARHSLKTVLAAERRAEFEDNLWKQRIRAEKAIPDLSAPKPAKPVVDPSSTESPAAAAVPAKPELTDEQIEVLIAKREKESDKRKNAFQSSQSELINNINKYEKKLGIHPVGRDRTFRRYWVFSSFPGLFVENDDEYIGECTGPTPIIPNVNVDDINFVKSHFEKLKQEDENLNNKENSSAVQLQKVVAANAKVKQPNPAQPHQPLPVQICNGNNKTCRIHSKLNLAFPKWSFYSTEQQINELIENLTPRGIREKELRTFLIDEKDGMIQLLKKCPKYKLNFKYPSDPSLVGERKSNRIKNALDPNLNFPAGTSINKIYELQIRDLILEMEDKIFLGGLGSLKIKDRAEWRSSIETRKYDPMVETLYWGPSKVSSMSTTELPPPSALRSADLDYKPIIKDMACALLQLEQSIEAKFFKKPLGIDKEKPTKEKKVSLDVNSEQNPKPPTQLEKWELSLMRCVNFGQLFVHLFTLDNSIEWARSVLNARCRVCRRKGDGENMLLCDHCNKGHHLYCLKPQLEVIPKGDWFCVDCRPVEVLKPRTQTTKKYYKEEDEDDEDEEDEGEEEEEDEEDAELDPSLSVPEVCEVCGYGGEVICCDGCPNVYHLYCLNPPKTRVPRGEWLCEHCINPKKKGRNARGGRKAPAAPKKKTSRQISNSSSNSTTITPSETSEDEEEEEEEQDQDRGKITGDESEDDVKRVRVNKSSNPNSEDEPGDEEEEEDEEEDVKKPVVKVKFNSTKTRPTIAAPRKYESEESGSGSSSGGHRSSNNANASNSNGRARARSSRQSINKGGKRKISSTSSEDEGDEDDEEESSSPISSSDDEIGASAKSKSWRSSGSDVIRRNTRLQRHSSTKIQETNELDNVRLDKLLVDIMKHKDAWPFLKPVTKQDAPDYHEIVTNPMDLGTMKYKLNSMVYTCNTEFIGDLRLIFDNCFLYNPPGNQIFKAAEDLQLYCEKRCNHLGITFESN